MSFFLDQINPLRSLDLPSLIALQDQAMRGYYARLQWTYYYVEKKDPIARAVKRRLLSALSGLDWNIKQPEFNEDEADKKKLSDDQAKTLRAAYDNISNLRAALTFLALADLRGFSHCEKIYAGAIDPSTDQPFNADLDPWDVIELRIVEQWFWVRNGFYGDWLYNQDALTTNIGEPVELDHFVVHTVDDPADEIFAEIHIKRKVNDADWDGFLEDYGIPPLFIGMPPSIPAAREAEYQRAAEQTVSRARGALPHGATLLTPSASGSGGAGVFSERLKYLDEQIVIAGTAGKLTVLSEAGSGTLAGTAQKEAFDEIAQAIANQVATALHKQFDEPLLAKKYPDQPVLAYFEFAQINVKDTSAVLTDAAAAATAGFAMDEEELSEKTGYKLTYVGLPGAAPKTNSADTTASSPGGSAVPPGDAKNNAGATPATTTPVVATPAPVVAPADPLDQVAEALRVTPEFVAPAKSVIDELIALAQQGPLTADELTEAAQAILKKMPELALKTDVAGVAAALDTALTQTVQEAVA